MASASHRLSRLNAVPPRSSSKKAHSTPEYLSRSRATSSWAQTAKRHAATDESRAEMELRALRNAVQVFEEAAGIKLTTYSSAGRQGEAVKWAMAAQGFQAELREMLRRTIKSSEALAGAARAQLEDVEKPV